MYRSPMLPTARAGDTAARERPKARVATRKAGTDGCEARRRGRRWFTGTLRGLGSDGTAIGNREGCNEADGNHVIRSPDWPRTIGPAGVAGQARDATRGRTARPARACPASNETDARADKSL